MDDLFVRVVGTALATIVVCFAILAVAATVSLVGSLL